MAQPKILPRVDTVIEVKENYAQLDYLWVTNLVDTMNTALEQIQERLVAGGL